MTTNITIFGTGYVGLVTGVCFAEAGYNVTCVDIDQEKLAILKKGHSHFYEPKLEALLTRNIFEKRIRFTDNAKEAISKADFIFIAVGTPSAKDGSADLSFVFKVAETIGQHLQKTAIIVDKSTVPVGTGAKVEKIIQDELDKRKSDLSFVVASNPEFLKQGDAINDFFNADRVVIGANDDNALHKLAQLYKLFKGQLIKMDRNSAELTKYAANSFLAARISFMNEIAAIADKVGANVDSIRQGIGSDPRVGPYFLYAGCGYGGSCFPKDVKALEKMAKENDIDCKIVKAVDEVNENQKLLLFNRVNKYFKGKLRGKTFALWGLAFKPNTDDMREAPSKVIMKLLWDAGAKVKAFDPIAHTTAKKIYGDHSELTICEKLFDTLDGVDALIIVTEWNEFRSADLEKIKNTLKKPVIFDGRNIYDPKKMREMGFEYFSIGRP